MFTKRSVVVVYLNILLLSAVVTLLVVKVANQDNKVAKRQEYFDVLGLECARDSDCGDHGECVATNPDDGEFGQHYCSCEDGYTHLQAICDYKRVPQFNTFLASFFGGSVGADWFYLYNQGGTKYTNGGYIAAGVFKLLSGGGFSIWVVVDWVRVLTQAFPDANGMALYENLTDTDI